VTGASSGADHGGVEIQLLVQQFKQGLRDHTVCGGNIRSHQHGTGKLSAILFAQLTHQVLDDRHKLRRRGKHIHTQPQKNRQTIRVGDQLAADGNTDTFAVRAVNNIFHSAHHSGMQRFM
jgi:hypothetical protein